LSARGQQKAETSQKDILPDRRSNKMEKQILLIEDHFRLRSMFKGALEEVGFLVKEISSPFEAFEEISESVDLIIYNMTFSYFHSIADEILSCATGKPVRETNYQNGIGMLEAVRNRGYKTKILFICNQIPERDKFVANQHGPAAYIGKPFEVEQVIEFIADWLDVEIVEESEKEDSELLTD
jgi:DNA-binding response OmpR family regulator